jgi:hypothetical protein
VTRAALLLLACACFDPALGRSPFLCGPGEACPDGFDCVGGTCTARGAPPGDARTADARSADARSGDARIECDATRPTQCDGDELITCSSSGAIVDRETCRGFCQPTSQTAARCATLVPANLPGDPCGLPALRPRVVSSDLEIDTQGCVDGRLVEQNGGGQICLLEYTHFEIEPGVTVRAAGLLPLAVVADTILIGGALDVSAEGPSGGAGSGEVGAGDQDDGSYTSGGGGGGFATRGAGGATDLGNILVSGGSSYGNRQLVPLIGGSAGGRGGVTSQICTVGCPTPARGGGGGGALQLVACKSLHLGAGAQVRAVGGGGEGGFAAPLAGVVTTAGGGGGGGSGGAILVESPRVVIAIAAFFAATGGGGGGGGGLDDGDDGGDGDDGHDSRPALGGSPGAQASGRGGAGGTRDADATLGALPLDGFAPQANGHGAGGGGGAAGRIRINVAPIAPLDPGSFRSLPHPSVGVISGR